MPELMNSPQFAKAAQAPIRPTIRIGASEDGVERTGALARRGLTGYTARQTRFTHPDHPVILSRIEMSVEQILVRNRICKHDMVGLER